MGEKGVLESDSMQKQEHWRRLLLRSEETATAYERAQRAQSANDGCRLCRDPDAIAEYKYWRLMPNLFPYDRLFSKSDMLVLRRHSDEYGLREDERAELLQLKCGVLVDEYDALLEQLPKQRSIPHHFHVHLVQYKRPV